MADQKVVTPVANVIVPTGNSVIQLVEASDTKGPLDFATYGPAIPGVIVALLGFWIAHALTVKRERRKEAADICDQIEELAEAALESALAGWSAPVGTARMSATYKAKWDAQKLGAAVTRLHNKTSDAMHTGIDLIQPAAEFRTKLFEDPTQDFLDASRPAVLGKDAGLQGAMSTFIGRANYLRDIVLR